MSTEGEAGPPPAAAPPPGQSADDFSGDTHRMVCIWAIIISGIALVLRFWSRGMIKSNERRFWWDDWVALAAFPPIISMSVLLLVAYEHGLGRRVWTLEFEDVKRILLFNVIILYIYYFTIYLLKESALLFFWRIFPARANVWWFNWSLYVIHALNAMWLLGSMLSNTLLCNPVQGQWEPLIDSSCGDTASYWIATRVPSCVIDLMILLLPIPKIWGLNMGVLKKVGLTITFVLGYIVIIVSVGSLIVILQRLDDLTNDISYTFPIIASWTGAESPVMVLCVSLPAMLPLGRAIGRKYFSPIVSKMSTRVKTYTGGARTLSSQDQDREGFPTKPTASESYHMQEQTRPANQAAAAAYHPDKDMDSLLSHGSTGNMLPPRGPYDGSAGAGIRVEKAYMVNSQHLDRGY